MKKTNFKPGNMLYPLPAVLVSCGETPGVSNILTVAWTGTLCTNPPMAYIAIRPERHSYAMIRQSGEFVINLTTQALARATDYCGVRSGRDRDKWADCRLTPVAADTVRCPLIDESPVNIECKVRQVLEPGSHHVFVADVTAVHVAEKLLDEKGALHLERAGLIAYSHGSYFSLGKMLGTFGESVRRKRGGSKTQKPHHRKGAAPAGNSSAFPKNAAPADIHKKPSDARAAASQRKSTAQNAAKTHRKATASQNRNVSRKHQTSKHSIQ